KLITRDSKSDRIQAGTAATELLSKKAEFIAAPGDFDVGAPACLVAQTKKVACMSLGAGTVQFGVQGIGPYASPMGTSGATISSVLAEWAHAKGWRNAYVLQDDFILYEKQSCRAFDAKWRSLSGAKVVGYDHFQQSDASIASQITKIKSLPK